MEEIFGYVESIVFSGETFSVARLKEPRKSELTCIVGLLPTLQIGETIRCIGVWKHHPQYGMQFEVKTFELKEPSDLFGIQKYLESGLIKGIGSTFAERIVKKFGIDTLKIIDVHVERLLEVDGIGFKRIEMINTSWKKQKSVRDVMIFLQTYDISPAYAQKIYRVYGEESIAKVKEDPFALARDVSGIGFKIADQIAQKMGMSAFSPGRIRAGINYVLWELSSDGHTCYPEKDLAVVATHILQLPKEDIDSHIAQAIAENAIVSKRSLVWNNPFYYGEIGIAKEIERLKSHRSLLRDIDTPKAISWVEKVLHLECAAEQKLAISLALQEKFLVITGGPGTGKSTITHAIVKISEKLTDQILLAAPTGRAAKRMTDITKKKATTIHSLLESDFQSGGFKKNRDNLLKCDLIIIDEASMMDTLLFYHLLKAIPSSARVIMIGDIDQLPSVGPGNVLKDLIASEKVCVIKLSQIYRQAARSAIVTNAHLINRGELPILSKNLDFKFIEHQQPENILSEIIALVSHKVPKHFSLDPFNDIQVLSPMKRGLLGIENLNVVLQNALNPSKTPLSRLGRVFHLHDKVMQIRNDYDKLVFNGDVGRIIAIDGLEQRLTVQFEENLVEYPFSQIDDLVLAYAVSVHKYQGCECPCVIIPMHTMHFKMLHRNLLYTGITRGKKLVILVGTREAIATAVKNDEVRNRYTGLKEALIEFVN